MGSTSTKSRSRIRGRSWLSWPCGFDELIGALREEHGTFGLSAARGCELLALPLSSFLMEFLKGELFSWLIIITPKRSPRLSFKVWSVSVIENSVCEDAMQCLEQTCLRKEMGT